MRIFEVLGSRVSIYSHHATICSSRVANVLFSIHQDQIYCGKALTRDPSCKLGRNSEAMNCAPSVGTINLVMNNTL